MCVSSSMWFRVFVCVWTEWPSVSLSQKQLWMPTVRESVCTHERMCVLFVCELKCDLFVLIVSIKSSNVFFTNLPYHGVKRFVHPLRDGELCVWLCTHILLPLSIRPFIPGHATGHSRGTHDFWEAYSQTCVLCETKNLSLSYTGHPEELFFIYPITSVILRRLCSTVSVCFMFQHSPLFYFKVLSIVTIYTVYIHYIRILTSKLTDKEWDYVQVLYKFPWCGDVFALGSLPNIKKW